MVLSSQGFGPRKYIIPVGSFLAFGFVLFCFLLWVQNTYLIKMNMYIRNNMTRKKVR